LNQKHPVLTPEQTIWNQENMCASLKRKDSTPFLKLAKNSAIRIESQEERRTGRDNHRAHDTTTQHIDIKQQKQQTRTRPGFILPHNLFLCNNSTET
jgi:hypothetical protein